MKFSISKCTVLSLQRGKKVRWEGIELPKGDKYMKLIAGITNI